MADAEHLAKLSEGPAAWNAWRDSNPEIVPDLAGADLPLNQRQFGPSTGGPINLSGANLEGAMLRFATLTGADLGGASLIGAELTHARLDRVRLVRADLTDAILDNADLAGASLDAAVLIGASLQNVRNLTPMQVQEAYGDATTLLPAALIPPTAWFPEAVDDDADDFESFGVADHAEDEDAYAVLGLQDNASPEEVRAAYRTLVKKLHPDLNPGDTEAELRFRKINDAYQRLRYLEEEAEQDRLRARRRQRTGIAVSFAVAVLVAGGASYWFMTREPDGGIPGRMPPVRDDLAQSAAAGSGLGQEGKAEEPAGDTSPIAPAKTVETGPGPETAKGGAATSAPADTSEILNTAAISKERDAVAAFEQTPASTSETTATTPAGAENAETDGATPAADAAKADAKPAEGAAADEAKPAGEAAVSASKPDGAKEDETVAAADAQADAQESADTAAEADPAAAEQPADEGWEQAWLDLRYSNDLLSLHGFLVQYPDAPPAKQARARLRSLIAALEDADQLVEFLQGTDDRDDAEIRLARTKLTKMIVGDALRAEQKTWNTAQKKGTEKAFSNYLRAYPKGPHARRAKEQIERLRAERERKRDEAAWAKARKDNTRASYSAYLKAFPRGHFSKDAEKKLAELSAKPKPRPLEPFQFPGWR